MKYKEHTLTEHQLGVSCKGPLINCGFPHMRYAINVIDEETALHDIKSNWENRKNNDCREKIKKSLMALYALDLSRYRKKDISQKIWLFWQLTPLEYCRKS